MTAYPKQYNPQLLEAIPRSINRSKLNIDESALPFQGADIWNVYEISWLNSSGKPQAGIGRFVIPCETENLVESKSLKLYLNSFNEECYDSLENLSTVIQADLSALIGSTVDVDIVLLGTQAVVIETPDGLCLDEQDIVIDQYQPNKELLTLKGEGQAFEQIVDEVLYSNLFKSNCPVTGQPDWATITICYHGKKISHAGLLKYLISYRQHSDYHENCVETIFQDIQNRCEPLALTVEGNFLRRGGIDINPVRTTEQALNFRNFPRFIRQ